MKQILLNSLAGQFCLWLIKFYNDVIKGWLSGSLFSDLSNFYSRHYQNSFVKRFIEKRTLATPAVYNSRFIIIFDNSMQFIRKLLTPPIKFIEKMFFASFIYKLWVKLYDKIEKARGNGSVIAYALTKLNVHRLWLTAVVFYLPIDYILRNYIKVDIISSFWDEIMLFVGFIIGLYAYFSGRREKLSKSPIDITLIAFISLMFFLMLTNSEYLRIGIEGFRAVVQYMFFFFPVIWSIRDEDDIAYILGLFAVMVTFIALHGIYQYIMGVEIPAQWVSQTEVGVRTRAFSIVGSPNVLGSLLIMGMSISAGFLYALKKPILKVLAFFSLAAGGFAIIFTFSRGAWVGLAVTILVFAFIVDKRLILLLFISAACGLIFIPSITNRITYLFTPEYVEASQAAGRMGRWEIAFQFLNRNRLTGFGLGSFGGAVAMNNQVMPNFDYFYMDNYYLKTLVETGYVGLFSYILLLLNTLYYSLKSILRAKTNKYYYLLVGVMSGMAGVLVHSYTENIFEVPYMNAYFWVLAACVIGFSFVINNKKEDQNA